MRLAFTLLALLTGCAPWTRPRGASETPCGEDGAPACVELFPKPKPPPPVTPERIRAVQGALAEACPPPTAEDPTPGLSSSARAFVPPTGRICRSPLSEIQGIESLLPTIPKDDPSRPRAIERLAYWYTWFERTNYFVCRSIVVPPNVNAEKLADLEQSAMAFPRLLNASRKRHEHLCKILRREYPDRAPSPNCEAPANQGTSKP